jgi:hypothetical protein
MSARNTQAWSGFMTICPATALILGAGFSFVAGLPLAKDLFDGEYFVPSKAAEKRYEAVLQSWRAWRSIRPDQGPEEFLTEIYQSPKIGPVPWSWATEMVAAILATPLPHDRGPYQIRYANRITRPVNVPRHNAFWDVLLSNFHISAVVTTNYDLLIERGLRHRPTQRPKRPGFYYGGLHRPQILKGTALPFSVAKAEREIELNGSIPLYKLHGSLNWGLSRGLLALDQDNRPAFRHRGDTQIVPPIFEKQTPSWLRNVWDEAGYALASCSTWIVCGYSLPIYDHLIAQLFADAAKQQHLTEIILLDPNSQNLHQRWKGVAPNTLVRTLPGIPEGLRHLVFPQVTSTSGQ